MSKNKILLFSSLLVFIVLVGYALWRELDRNEALIRTSISGVVHLAPGIGDVVRTDNAHVILIDPQTHQPVALQTLNPFVPPLTFQIGQEHVLGNFELQGDYRLLVVSDKDAKIENPAPGEVIGEVTEPVALSTEEYQYHLTQPFRQWPAELQAHSSNKSDPATMIQGKILVAEDLKSQIQDTDRLIIMLFDPKQGRPVAIKMMPRFQENQSFAIGQANAMPGQTLEGEYSLRILTDKNNQPFESAPGEIVGRSSELIPLGTEGIEFLLDENYVR